jgi:hypothetical protein
MNAISAQADAERRPPREGNSRCVLLVGVLMIIEKSWARAGSYLGSTVELCHILGCSGHLMTVNFHVVSSNEP